MAVRKISIDKKISADKKGGETLPFLFASFTAYIF